ncbi:GNAT family N-acetyltransferase [Turicimonas muris]|uniref:GNAT family N-acetyltransferase n=1 Tax=Turicimonas muris TaxID=1796652 RepID=UPI002494BC0A|nr:GNAT family protein [Turicimonas muris]
MKQIVYGRGGPLLQFADEKILSNDKFPEDAMVFGLVEGSHIHGVCVFTDYRETTINMHVAGAEKGWITRDFIRACFHYVFNELRCHTALGLVRTDNQDALLFDTKLGFKVRGTIPKGDYDGCDFYLMAMTKDECKWLKKAMTGKEQKW